MRVRVPFVAYFSYRKDFFLIYSFFSYETSNGISRSEIGTVINKGQPNEHVVVEGRNSYINAKGEEQIFRYVADENGYRVLPLPRVVVS